MYMNTEQKTTSNYNRVEFWAATVLYALSIFLLISQAVKYGLDNQWNDVAARFSENNCKFSYMENYFWPKAGVYTAFYGAYILLTLYIVPPIMEKRQLPKNILSALAIFLLLGIAMGTAASWTRAYQMGEFQSPDQFYNYLFREKVMLAFWMLFLFVTYNVIKYFAIYLLSHENELQEKYKGIEREMIIAFILWMVTFFLLLVAGAEEEIIFLYALAGPFAIGLYWYSLHKLIPSVQETKRKFLRYILKVLQILLVAAIPVTLVLLAVFRHGDASAAIQSANAAVQLFITVPLSWFMYKYKQTNKSEISTLRQALGTSTANLQLLKSQINPHFLFNSLNTLYGTALQENADRTAEGVQRLGDMMRFMLEENEQDKISLNREVEYIRNYISLQTLRTQNSPGISITVNIDEGVNHLSITPMLLIPFIENAFKHGISLREPSHIKISMQVDQGNIFFDVYNSVHAKQDNDPEKDNTGIGLNNVRQRLQLFYPGKHELIIRENANEFFVHLTIQLN